MISFKIVPSNYCNLKMFLLSAQNNFHVILSSYVEEHVKNKLKSEFHVCSSFPGFENLVVFLENSFPGSTNSLKPPVSRFCDSLLFGLEELRELRALLD